MDLGPWQRGQSAVCHMQFYVTTGTHGDTQERIKCPRWAGTERMVNIRTIVCPNRSWWVWDCVPRRFWRVKKRKKPRTGEVQWPGSVLTCLCLPLSVLLLLNRTAPDINTTLLQMSWKSPPQLWCTLRSWAGKLTGQGTCAKVDSDESDQVWVNMIYFFLCF